MMGKIFLGILGIVFLFAFASPIQSGIHNWRADSITQTVNVVTASETTKNVTLTRELMNDAVTEIVSMTSTYAETPIAGTFTPPYTLNLTNLASSQTRDITLVYYSESTDTYMNIFGPFLTILIFGGILAAIVLGIWISKGSRR